MALPRCSFQVLCWCRTLSIFRGLIDVPLISDTDLGERVSRTIDLLELHSFLLSYQPHPKYKKPDFAPGFLFSVILRKD
jgi:hypothetical protein